MLGVGVDRQCLVYVSSAQHNSAWLMDVVMRVQGLEKRVREKEMELLDERE